MSADKEKLEQEEQPEETAENETGPADPAEEAASEQPAGAEAETAGAADEEAVAAVPRYKPTFHREFRLAESGKWASQCMQCGLCVTTCPAYELMELTPREMFKWIHAGEAKKVLSANTPWLCTSCYLCTVRCPRGIPIVDVMGSLKYMLGGRMGGTGVPLLSEVFFQSALKRGRVYEAMMTNNYFMFQGPASIPIALKQVDVGIQMMLHRRLPLLPPPKIKGIEGLQKIVKRAEEMQEAVAKARLEAMEEVRQKEAQRNGGV